MKLDMPARNHSCVKGLDRPHKYVRQYLHSGQTCGLAKGFICPNSALIFWQIISWYKYKQQARTLDNDQMSWLPWELAQDSSSEKRTWKREPIHSLLQSTNTSTGSNQLFLHPYYSRNTKNMLYIKLDTILFSVSYRKHARNFDFINSLW